MGGDLNRSLLSMASMSPPRTNHGRIDMTVRFNGNVYIFEFKVVELGGEGSAMAQLLQRGYAEKYLSGGEPVHLIGIEFSKEKRNVAAFAVERA